MTASYEADISLQEMSLLSHSYHQLQTPTNPTDNWTLHFLNVVVYSHGQLSVQINICKSVCSTGSTAKLV